MRSRHSRSGNGAMLEQLERRRLLAGNVTVTDDGSLVTVKGDNKANEILITFDPGVTYQVVGLDGTTVNSGASAHAHPTSFESFKVDMGNGDDVVRVSPTSPNLVVDFPDMSITTGNGDDSVLIDRATFTNLAIDTGNGSDDVRISNVSIPNSGAPSSVSIDTGNGPDTVTLAGSVQIATSTPFTIDGGNGPDVLDLSGLAAPTSFSVQVINVEKIIFP